MFMRLRVIEWASCFVSERPARAQSSRFRCSWLHVIDHPVQSPLTSIHRSSNTASRAPLSTSSRCCPAAHPPRTAPPLRPHPRRSPGPPPATARSPSASPAPPGQPMTFFRVSSLLLRPGAARADPLHLLLQTSQECPNMPFVEQLLQALDPTRQLRAPLRGGTTCPPPRASPARAGRPASGSAATEQPPQPPLQTRLAVDDDLHRLGGPGGEPAAASCLHLRPLQRRLPRAERPEHLLVEWAVQPAVFAAAAMCTSPPAWRCGRSCSCPPSSAASSPVAAASPGHDAADTCSRGSARTAAGGALPISWSMAVGTALPSISMTSTSPSPAGKGPSLM